MAYDFDIIYKHGSSNKADDALSRREEEGELNGLTKPCWLDAEKIDKEVRKDSHLSKAIEELEKNLDSHRH